MRGWNAGCGMRDAGCGMRERAMRDAELVLHRSSCDGFEQFAFAAGERACRTRGERPDLERAEARAHEPENLQAERLENPAHLAVLALADRNGELPQAVAHRVRLDVVGFHEAVRSEEHTSELQSRQYLVC